MSDPHLQEVAHWHPIEGTPEKKRVAIGCSVGAVIETYDFIGFGTAAALYFGQVFFPESDPLSPRCCRSRRWASGSRCDRWAALWAATSATRSAASLCWSARCC